MDSAKSAEKILMAIQSVIGSEPVSLHSPEFSGNEWNYVKECLDSTYVSYRGKFVDEFESALASYTGVKHVVLVVNGTTALQIALKLVGVEPNDEVLIPALTFVATANAVSHCGATPNIVDSEEGNLGIDPERLRIYLQETADQVGGLCVNRKTGRVIRALVPMHTFGHPSRIEDILQVARDFNLALVEDAAESLGSFYKNRHTGTFGLIGTLSFNGNKIITTGGGGAIMTNDSLLAERARHLTTTAKIPHPWEFDHDEVGFNYRMPNLNAAIGLAQLEQLDDKLKRKRDLFSRYEAEFRFVQDVSLFREPVDCRSNYWLQTILLSDESSALRERILESTNKMGISTRPAWKLINTLAPYQNCPKMDLNVAASLYRRIINLPSSASLSGVVS